MRNHAILRQPAFTFLAIGAAAGLILGLLIGWVFWPVQWEGATLRDLYPSEKAEYIAAVADAFVIYDSPEAAEVALRRLTAIDDGNLAQTFQDALGYFGASSYSDKAIRDSNIRRLAVALNMVPPTIAVAPQAQTSGGEATATTATVFPTPIPAPDESTGELGWVGWLLWFLTAVLLLAGGMYILRKAGLPDLQAMLRARTQPATEDEIDEFETPAARQPRNQLRNKLISPQPAATADYPFEDDDEWPPIGDEQVRRTISNRYSADGDFGKDEYVDGDYTNKSYAESDFVEDVDDEPPFDDEDDDAAWRPAGKSYTIDVTDENPPSGNSAAYAPPSSATDARNRQRDLDIDADLAQSDDPKPKAALSTAVAPLPGTLSTRQANPQSAARAPFTTRARPTVIDQHVFHYQIGMMEYDESRPIVDPKSGKYIGEFGMGASDKNALMQTGPHQLVALEVWIFDKSDERNLGNQTRILLSEYAIDHNLEQLFLKERQDNPRPFTAQSGVHFQLESQNLLLDCTIVDVLYSTSSATKGIFQEITVDMSVQQKG